jgi:hypothetical protein
MPKKLWLLLILAALAIGGCSQGEQQNRGRIQENPPAQTGHPAAQTPTPAPDYARLAPSTQMEYEELVEDNGEYGSPKNVPPAGTYSLEIDLTNCVLRVLNEQREDVRLMLCTIGEEETPTPKGTFEMGEQRERFGYFKEFDCYAQYWTQIQGDIFIHSVLYEEEDAGTLIKGSYQKLGEPSSHGCVRLTVPDARWIYENIAPGTCCRVYEGKKDPELRRALQLPPQP